jgi:hypothetical protein
MSVEQKMKELVQAGNYLSGGVWEPSRVNPKWQGIATFLERNNFAANTFLFYIATQESECGAAILPKIDVYNNSAVLDRFSVYHAGLDGVAKNRIDSSRYAFEALLKNGYPPKLLLLGTSAADLDPVARCEIALEFQDQLDPAPILERYITRVKNRLFGIPQYLNHCPRLAQYLKGNA